MMIREEMLRRVRERARQQLPWDIAVIGGGATGVGVALDAAARGFDVVLLEARDFGQGTSSRSTKLAHGGVRYLRQGHLPLVLSALKERGLMRRNAPHLVHDLPFVVPSYSWWEGPFYGAGLKLYDLLAGEYGFGASTLLTREQTLTHLPALDPEGLLGGVIYHDGQFDDARLLIHLAMTAADRGAVLLNHCPVTGLIRDPSGAINGLTVCDHDPAGPAGAEFSLNARVVVNATGVFTDEVRRLADPTAEAMLAPSQGIHLVFDRGFLKGDSALMVPRTSDGRVLFVIPWHGHVLAGTTDTPVVAPTVEPRPLPEEIDFILDTVGRYLTRHPGRADVLSVFAGLRPLVKGEGATSSLSRDHVIHEDASGLLTVTGGKWTTYRLMAEECVDHAIALGQLSKAECVTKSLRLHGYTEAAAPDPFAVYGSDADAVRELARQPGLGAPLHPALPYIAAEVVWSARAEMARCVKDVLARRTRALFLNAGAAATMAAHVARILATELNRDQDWIDAQCDRFRSLAAQYTVPV